MDSPTAGPAPDALTGLLDRVVRRAGPARLVIHRLPERQWSITLFLPEHTTLRGETRGHMHLAYHGDTIGDALRDCLEDPVSDLRGLRA